MDKNEFAQAELVALRKGLEEASKIIEALEAENAALKARGPALSEDEWRSVSFALGCLEARIDANGESHEMYDEAVEHSNTLRNLLERVKP
jgi:chromosome segregation ATPase